MNPRSESRPTLCSQTTFEPVVGIEAINSIKSPSRIGEADDSSPKRAVFFSWNMVFFETVQPVADRFDGTAKSIASKLTRHRESPTRPRQKLSGSFPECRARREIEMI